MCGMYSRLDWEEVDVTDWDGLKTYLKEFEALTEQEDYVKMLDKKNKTIDFGSRYGDVKLIGYWYDEDILFFRNISKYVEGHIKWIYETDEEQATITFKNGKTTFEIGKVEFKEIKLDVRTMGNPFEKPQTHNKNYIKYKEFEKKHQFLGSL